MTRFARSVLLVALLTAASTACPAAVGAAPSPVVLAPAGSGRAYTSVPGSHALLLVRRDGAVLAAQHFDSDPTALALDQRRGLLYVALRDSNGILVLHSSRLDHVLTLPAVAAATRLAAVPGRNALRLFDPATGRTLYLTYTQRGAVHLAPVGGAGRRHAGRRPTPRPATAQLHVFLSPYSPHTRQQATFWANGFRPGETVSLSWGAHSQGSLRADRYGIVGGSLAGVTGAAPGLHSVGLYGLDSHLALTSIVTVGPVRDGRVGRKAALPPLYLGFLPGPRAVLSPPLLHRKVRVPYSASALPAVPLVALLGWAASRRRKRKRAADKKKPARRTR